MIMSAFSIVIAAILTVMAFDLQLQGVSAVRMYMAESDIRTTESSRIARVTAWVEVPRRNTTMVVIPLTVSQYLNGRSLYGKVCDTLLLGEARDEAEANDFSALPEEMSVNRQLSPRIYELTVDIPLHDDNVQEPAEYFLAVLATKQPGESKFIVDTDSNRQCSRIDIDEDNDDFGVTFEPLVDSVSEDAGVIEAFKVVKKGRTEKTVTISLFILVAPAYYRNPVSSIPSEVVLTSNEREMTVNVTISDDGSPERDTDVLIYGDADTRMYGKYRNLPLSVEFTVTDNDHAVIGFEQTEVTVIEGEDAILTTFFRTNLSSVDYHGELFTVFSQVGKGNATALKHYIDVRNNAYHPGDLIKIPTIDDDNLEQSRWFEVRLTDPNSNPLYLLEPNTARVIILDNDGTPSQLSIGKVTFDRRNITVSWTSPKDDLRPVHGYMITVEMTGAEDKNESSQSTKSTVKRQENKNTQVYHFNFTEGDCKFNPLSETELCEVTLQLDAILGSYTITVCATNSFGTTCGSVQQTLDVLPSETSAELSSSNRESGLSLGVIVGLVVGVVVTAALCCVAFTYCTVVIRRRKQKQQDTFNDEIESSIGGSTQDSIKLSQYVALQQDAMD